MLTTRSKAEIAGLAALALLAAVALTGIIHAAPREKAQKAAKTSKVIATVDGVEITKAEYDTAIKGNRRFFDLTRDSIRHKLAGKPWTEYVFSEEIVKTKAFANRRAAELPQMKQAAEAALQRVRGGEDFAAVAAEVSQDKVSAANGGDLGEPKAFFDLVHPFSRVALSMKEGEISEPVLTIFGYHIIKVDKIWPPMEGKPKRVQVRHILIPFQGSPRVEAEAALAQAEVEILVERPYCKQLPSYCEAAK